MPESIIITRKTGIARRPNCGIERAIVDRKIPSEVTEKRKAIVPAINRGIEPAIGTSSNPCTTIYREKVAAENIFIFGLKAEEIKQLKETNSYEPYRLYEQSNDIKRVMDSFKSDAFCQKEPGLFNWIYESLLINGDVYFHLADFEPYVETQKKIEDEFTDKAEWTKIAILNVARIGKFSSDRTISEYAKEIWRIKSYSS
jgi:hypothetical protein